MDAKVHAYIAFNKQWSAEMKALQDIALDCGLTEELKWGKPCYLYNGSNIVIIQGFKDYCALMFFKGALLKDPDNILVKTGENTQVGRQAHFTNIQQIRDVQASLKACIFEAIEAEKAGLKVEVQKPEELDIPDELQQRFDEDEKFRTAFQSLTPGRQRAYIYHFSSAKQSQTRTNRINKYYDQILAGKGLMD